MFARKRRFRAVSPISHVLDPLVTRQPSCSDTAVARRAAAALALLSLIAAAGCSKPPAANAASASAMGPLPVAVVPVQQQDVALTGDWVGTLDGYTNAQIQPQVSGYLIRQLYKEGSPVQKGQVLFQIDPRPFQALVDQAQGTIGQAQGQLGQAQAQLSLAQINLNRDTPLAEQHAIATSQLDNDKQTAAQAQASVASAKASIAAAQAQAATARLNLGFTQVRSLIAGVAGQATTQVGNLVSPQSTLTSVSTLNPIKVYFSISDSEYLALANRDGVGHGDLLKSSARIPLTLTLGNGEKYPETGHIVFVDRQINQQTGAIRLAGAFDNPGNLLRPGQFAHIAATTQTIHNALLVPQIAVQELQGQQQVYTVGPGNKVHVVDVTLGPQSGMNWIIKSGLPANAQIITDQLQKLREGAPISPHPAAAATAPTTPTDSSAGR